MIYTVTLSALAIGIAGGWMLAGKFMLRTLAVVIIALGGTIVLVFNIPSEDWTEMYLVAVLCAPPMFAGLIGGAVFRWLFRRRATT